MKPHDMPPIGARIRAERAGRGMTLRGLAREVGVSASLISQIETDKAQPSVSTLYAITSALGVGRGPDDDGRRRAPPGGSGPEDAEPSVVRRVGPVVTPEERQVITLDSGVTWELLGELPGVPVEFLLVTYAPGGASSSTGLLMRHTGSEYGYLLQGELVLTLGFEELRLAPGDAVSFESSTPHAYRNEGDQPAVGVWFVLEGGGAG